MSKKEKKVKLILEEEGEDSSVSCKTNLEPEFKKIKLQRG
jgi:hypothetical protein